MKKYYAKPAPIEYFDGETYYDEGMAAEDNFGAGGNRDFCEINGSLRDDIKQKLEDLDYDTDNSYDSELTDKENFEVLTDNIHYYFPKSPGRELQYLKLAQEFAACRTQDENEVICDVLALEFDEPFITGSLRGNSQGDGMEYICPAKMKDRIPYIESILMGTGTEFAITDDKLDLDGKTEEEIDKAFEDADKFYDYTNLWGDDDIKEGIADMMHCTPEEVVLLEGDY